MTATPRSVRATLASSPIPENLVSRESVVLTFQLDKFIKTKHEYLDEFTPRAYNIINYIVSNTLRPATAARRKDSDLTERERRARQKSGSVEPPSYPTDWSIHRPAFRAALKAFDECTWDLRRSWDTPQPTDPSTSEEVDLVQPSQSESSRASGKRPEVRLPTEGVLLPPDQSGAHTQAQPSETSSSSTLTSPAPVISSQTSASHMPSSSHRQGQQQRPSSGMASHGQGESSSSGDANNWNGTGFTRD